MTMPPTNAPWMYATTQLIASAPAPLVSIPRIQVRQRWLSLVGIIGELACARTRPDRATFHAPGRVRERPCSANALRGRIRHACWAETRAPVTHHIVPSDALHRLLPPVWLRRVVAACLLVVVRVWLRRWADIWWVFINWAEADLPAAAEAISTESVSTALPIGVRMPIHRSTSPTVRVTPTGQPDRWFGPCLSS